MANDQKDQGFGENRPGQEKNQGNQNQPGNPGMKHDDPMANRPADANRGLNPQDQDPRKGSQQPYSERSSSTGMPDKDRDLNSPSSQDRGTNPSGTYTPGRDIDREGPSEPYGRESGSSTTAQGEPRREEKKQEEDDDDLTEIPSREEERKINTPSGNDRDLSSRTDDPTNPQKGKEDSKGSGNLGAE